MIKYKNEADQYRNDVYAHIMQRSRSAYNYIMASEDVRAQLLPLIKQADASGWTADAAAEVIVDNFSE